MRDMPDEIWAKKGYSDAGEGIWDDAEMGEDVKFIRADRFDVLLNAYKNLAAIGRKSHNAQIPIDGKTLCFMIDEFLNELGE